MLHKLNLLLPVVGGALLIFTPGFTADSYAASYKKLKSSGFKISRLTRNSAGQSGWIMKKGKDKQFCTRRAVTFDLGGGKGAIISPAGKRIRLDLNAMKKFIRDRGERVPRYPRWSDMKAGRVQAADVGRCKRYR